MRIKLWFVPLMAAFVFSGAGCQLFQTPAQYSHPIVSDGRFVTGTERTTTVTPTIVEDNVYDNPQTLTQVSFVGDRTVDRKPFLSNPFVFYGTTTVFENQFAWRVKDGQGNIVAGDRAYAYSPDMGQPGPFRIEGFFDGLPQTKEGLFELYDESPKDGSEIILVSVPVVFVDLEPQEVTVYFGNQQKNPEMLDCSQVFPVKRETVAAVKQPEKAAIHQLLKGPTADEREAGYFTSLPEDVDQPDIYWSEKGERKLMVDFNDTLEQGMGGSCRVSAVRAQIEKTVGLACLKGMCAIAVDGRTEDILQP